MNLKTKCFSLVSGAAQASKKVCLALVSCWFLMNGTAMASPFGPDGGTVLQGVFDSITVSPSPNPGQSSVDVTTDMLSDDLDSYWSITATGGSIATLIIELAGFANENVFGVYDALDPNKRVTIFGGPDGPGNQAALGIKDTGEVFVNLKSTGVFFAGNLFGYFLDSSANSGGDLFFSDTSLNKDGVDHMYAYQGKNIDTVKLPTWSAGLWTSKEYILAFEDLYNGGDRDYTDFVVMVESVRPVSVSEPGTLALMGVSLILVGALRNRRRNQAA